MMQQRVKYWDIAIDWIFNGKYHRDGDLPARYYFRYGKLSIVNYHQHGGYHRTTGPAVNYFSNYFSKTKLYYYQGRKYASLEQMQMVEACN